YCIPLSSGLPTLPNRRIMLVDSAAEYEYHYRRNPKYEYRKHSYSHEATYPLDVPKSDVRERLLFELNTRTGVKGLLIKRLMPCFVIRSDEGGPQHPQEQENATETRQLTLLAFVALLNR